MGPQASRLTSVTRVTAATSAGCLSSAAAAACAANAYPENLPVQRPLLQQQLQVGTAMRCVGVEVQRLQRMRSDRAGFEPDRRVDIFCHDGMHSRDGCILHETSTIRQYIAIVSGSGAGAELERSWRRAWFTGRSNIRQSALGFAMQGCRHGLVVTQLRKSSEPTPEQSETPPPENCGEQRTMHNKLVVATPGSVTSGCWACHGGSRAQRRTDRTMR